MFSNKLTPAQLERLAILSEECGEVQQAIGKILRHGYASRNPNDVSSLSNREMLEAEVGHVLYAVYSLWENQDILRYKTEAWAEKKRVAILSYLHHQ